MTYSPERTIHFEPGTYTGYKFDAYGNITGTKVGNIGSGGSSAPASHRRYIDTSWFFFITAGIWDGYWVVDNSAIDPYYGDPTISSSDDVQVSVDWVGNDPSPGLVTIYRTQSSGAPSISAATACGTINPAAQNGHYNGRVCSVPNDGLLHRGLDHAPVLTSLIHMSHLGDLYRANLSLLTDLYQLTMAYGYWKAGRADDEAVFHLFFRTPPFGSGYTIAAGLDPAIDLINDFRFERDDLDYLASLDGADGAPLFEREFLDYLGGLQLSVNVDAVPEGTVVFGNEPLLRVRGPLLQCQLLETALLNIVNFSTLVATKASRIGLAAVGGSLLEFGLRRAQGPDGAVTATRAAYIGGVDATSNVLAGKLLGIPVKGTHAHSWVMTFDSEPEAFEAYAAAMPGNALFLVDTYDTLAGVRNAIEVGKQLRERGQRLLGIRLDSGDLAYLSIEARKLLDAAGFRDAMIVASNDLDEHLIDSLREQGAQIAVWGVGTKLATSYDQPALGGVYKLGAIRTGDGDGEWAYRIKIAEQQIKTSIPGMLQVRRFRYNGAAMADMIFDEIAGAPAAPTLVDPLDPTRRRSISEEVRYEDLLVAVVRDGRRVYDSPSLDDIRRHRSRQISLFHPSIKRFTNPHQHPVGLESGLAARRLRMIFAARGIDPASTDLAA